MHCLSFRSFSENGDPGEASRKARRHRDGPPRRRVHRFADGVKSQVLEAAEISRQAQEEEVSSEQAVIAPLGQSRLTFFLVLMSLVAYTLSLCAQIAIKSIEGSQHFAKNSRRIFIARNKLGKRTIVLRKERR